MAAAFDADAWWIVDLATGAQEVCDGTSIRLATDEDRVRYQEVIRRAIAWKCPERSDLLAGLDATVAEVERRSAEADAAWEAEQAAEQEIGISAEEFAQLRDGMTLDDVTAVIGSPGELLSSTSIAGYSGEVYQWDGEPGTGLGANAIVQFQNGRLITKAQSGL